MNILVSTSLTQYLEKFKLMKKQSADLFCKLFNFHWFFAGILLLFYVSLLKYMLTSFPHLVFISFS